MVKIEIDNYILNADKYCFWIEKREVKKNKDGEDKTVDTRLTGYCTSYSDLLRSFVEHSIKEIDAERITKYVKKIKDIETDLIKLAEKLGEDLDSKK